LYNIICTEEVDAKPQKKKKAVTVDSKKSADAAGKKAETKDVGEVKMKRTPTEKTLSAAKEAAPQLVSYTPDTLASAASDTSQVTMFIDCEPKNL